MSAFASLPKVTTSTPFDTSIERDVAAGRVRRVRPRARPPGASAGASPSLRNDVATGAFAADAEVETFGDLRADRVVLIRRDRHRREDADDGHDDHELDQCEAGLPRRLARARAQSEVAYGTLQSCREFGWRSTACAAASESA